MSFSQFPTHKRLRPFLFTKGVSHTIPGSVERHSFIVNIGYAPLPFGLWRCTEEVRIYNAGGMEAPPKSSPIGRTFAMRKDCYVVASGMELLMLVGCVGY